MDFLNSFFQNIKDKLTSPFFGTLTFVLIIHHWEFWYTLFNFDKDCTRIERLAVLRLIASKEFGDYEILCDIAIAIGIMLLGYGIVVATRTLSLAIDFRIMPAITGTIISKKVVERPIHEEVVKERDEYSEKYEEQRRLVRKMSQDYDLSVVDIQKKNDSINEINKDISSLQGRISSLEGSLADERNLAKNLKQDIQKLNDKIKSLTSDLDAEKIKSSGLVSEIEYLLKVFLGNESFGMEQDGKIPAAVMHFINKTKESGDWRSFVSFLRFENKGGNIDSSTVTKMQELGLASVGPGERKTALAKVIEAYIPFLN